MLKWLQSFFVKKYRVSVIIPTYRNTEFLVECIESVIRSAKKCCDYEILLGIDNCKETLKFVEENSLFKNKNIRIYYFPKNVGPYIIRNSLAAEAKYDNILFFDSDDIMMEHMLETLLSRFEGKEILKFKFYNFNNGVDYKDQENQKISQIFAHGSFLIKKIKFFKMRGFYGWKCGADAEFDERYRGQGNAIPVLDVPMYYRRYHERNITRSPETGINSKLRSRYGNIILDNRKNGKWPNPSKPCIFNFNIVKL